VGRLAFARGRLPSAPAKDAIGGAAMMLVLGIMLVVGVAEGLFCETRAGCGVCTEGRGGRGATAW
jgi:hypothetical protein